MLLQKKLTSLEFVQKEKYTYLCTHQRISNIYFRISQLIFRNYTTLCI